MATSDMIDQLELFADTLKELFGEVDFVSTILDEQVRPGNYIELIIRRIMPIIFQKTT
jgi:hypothetical protein